MAKESIRDAACEMPAGPASVDPGEEAPGPRDVNEYRATVCRSCGVPRVFRRRRVNDSLHFMLALGTLGAWLPVWGLILLVHFFRPWICIFCGARRFRS